MKAGFTGFVDTRPLSLVVVVEEQLGSAQTLFKLNVVLVTTTARDETEPGQECPVLEGEMRISGLFNNSRGGQVALASCVFKCPSTYLA